MHVDLLRFENGALDVSGEHGSGQLDRAAGPSIDDCDAAVVQATVDVAHGVKVAEHMTQFNGCVGDVSMGPVRTGLEHAL